MPYTLESENLPPHVQDMPQSKKEQWIAIFNSTFEETGDEQAAFEAANGAAKDFKAEVREEAVKGFSPFKLLDKNRIGGYAIRWGSEEDTDLENDFFTPESDLWLSRIQPKVLLLNHRQPVYSKQKNAFVAPVDAKSPADWIMGEIVKLEPDEFGIWTEAILDEKKEWVRYARDNHIAKGLMGFSSDSVEHLIERVPTTTGAKWLKSWPFIMLSATHIPAEPDNEINFVKSAKPIEFYKMINPAISEALRPLEPEASQKLEEEEVPLTHSNEITPNEDKKMPIKFNEKLLASFHANAIVTSHADEILNEVKSMKMEMETQEDVSKQVGTMGEALQPIAQAVMEAVPGLDMQGALAAVTPFVVALLEQNMLPGEAPLEVEVESEMPEDTTMMLGEEPEEEEPVMSVGAAFDNPTPRKSADKNAVSYKGGAAILSHTGGMYQTRKNVNVIKARNMESQFTIEKTLRAQVNKDNRYLNEYARYVKDRYVKKYGGVANAVKALSINPDTAGGYLVHPEFADEVIEYLRAESVVFPLCRQITMNSDIMEIGKQTGAVTTYYGGENSQLTASQQTYGNVTLNARKLYGYVEASNELIQDATPGILDLTMEELKNAIAVQMDIDILTGDGAGGKPTGILNSGATATAAATPGDVIYADLVALEQRLEAADVRNQPGWVWVGNPRGKGQVRQIEDTEGQFIWQGNGAIGNQLEGGVPQTLMGYRWTATTSNQVDGNSRARLYLGNWQDVFVGIRKSLELRASEHYKFGYDQVAIRAIMRWDVVMAHTASIQILTSV